MSSSGGKKAIVAAFFANLGIAVAKLLGFFFTGAASMLAEAVHSAADTGNQGLLLLGSARAKKRPNRAHPFGHGGERFFWAFVVGIVLFSLGSLFALLEGIQKVRHRHDLDGFGIGVAILCVAIVLESLSLRTAVQEASANRGSLPWWRYVRESKVPEVPVVLLEDTGALVGLSFALAGVVIAQVTGDSRWDALGSIAIGLLLGLIAFVIAIKMKSLLIGEGASGEDVEAITEAINTAPGVRRLQHLQTLQFGPEEILVAASVEMEPHLTTDELVMAIDGAEARIREVVPLARAIYIEPDLADAPPEMDVG
jgi:cation diffusion facilitator family transporter